MELSEWRDVAVIAYSVAGTLAFAVILLFTIIIGYLLMSTIGRVRGLLKNQVQPALANVRQTTETVRGTANYISDYAVKPVVKAYGTYAGARRFVSVFVRLTRPKKA
jgi:hypothetical protein